MTHGTIRSYKIQLEGKDETQLRPILADEALRPRVGDQIKIADFPNQIFKITRSIPSNNPAGEAVTYVVEYESDRNRIAGGSVSSFAEYFIRSQKAGSPHKIY